MFTGILRFSGKTKFEKTWEIADTVLVEENMNLITYFEISKYNTSKCGLFHLTHDMNAVQLHLGMLEFWNLCWRSRQEMQIFLAH